jgi:endonuclease G, mitochondrial
MNIVINADPNATITINVVSNKPGGGPGTAGGQMESAAGGAAVFESADLESLAGEQNQDYSACEGYDDNFLGFPTPIPDLEKQLKRQAAKLTDEPESYILKYYHYSVIHHSVRKMPIVSAINIDADPKKRKDNSARKDIWLRDNRIDLDVQLTNGFYAKSGFDKGHMSRREDADWGSTSTEARLSANLTCMHTNACPQVPEINRVSAHGLWGQLEKIVLEKGVKKEEGEEARICVYNGPIFVSTDPAFKGVQVPLRFFKVIVWINAKEEKKTTAFILSQEDLVGDIQFEELQFDEEFKEHQCSVAYLENLTGISFTGIREWDTFKSDNEKGVKRVGKDELESMISVNS